MVNRGPSSWRSTSLASLKIYLRFRRRRKEEKWPLWFVIPTTINEDTMLLTDEIWQKQSLAGYETWWPAFLWTGDRGAGGPQTTFPQCVPTECWIHSKSILACDLRVLHDSNGSIVDVIASFRLDGEGERKGKERRESSELTGSSLPITTPLSLKKAVGPWGRWVIINETMRKWK